MDRLISLVKNKFLVAGIAFVVWMCFFDRYDLATQVGYQKEKSKLVYEKNYYTQEIANLETSIKDAQFNPSEIQRIAREKYKMKKENEDIYVITEIEPKEIKE